VSYDAFIAAKSKTTRFDGIPAAVLSSRLFPHQAALTSWALRRGRAAIFADTGLGKTWMEVEWARVVAERGRVLMLAPLAVAEQTVREARKLDVDVRYLRRDDGTTPVVITNYELLEHFDPTAFAGVVLDESSILKAYTGATRNAIIGAFAETPYRLACTATPAPNDYTELGNHSEFLGIKSRVEMLAEYFTHDGGSTQDWRLKGHAVESFWRWVCTWGAMVKRPSDLGYEDAGFALPPLRMHEHIVRVGHEDAHREGFLFAPEAKSLSDQRATRRMTMEARIAKAAELAAGSDPVLIWCELNDEADGIEAAIPGAVQVAGSDPPEVKADRMLGFSSEVFRVMVSKVSICGFGMNWQHCNRMIFLGASHSYEQTYQAVRRCWRFGQTKPVDVHVIRAETEQGIVANYRRKEADAERMADEMVARMRDSMRAEIGSAAREWNDYNPCAPMAIPTWLSEGP